jgi:hypothetical protein
MSMSSSEMSISYNPVIANLPPGIGAAQSQAVQPAYQTRLTAPFANTSNAQALLDVIVFS